MRINDNGASLTFSSSSALTTQFWSPAAACKASFLSLLPRKTLYQRDYAKVEIKNDIIMHRVRVSHQVACMPRLAFSSLHGPDAFVAFLQPNTSSARHAAEIWAGLRLLSAPSRSAGHQPSSSSQSPRCRESTCRTKSIVARRRDARRPRRPFSNTSPNAPTSRIGLCRATSSTHTVIDQGKPAENQVVTRTSCVVVAQTLLPRQIKLHRRPSRRVFCRDAAKGYIIKLVMRRLGNPERS